MSRKLCADFACHAAVRLEKTMTTSRLEVEP